MKKLILASASPRRKELLEQVGAVFEIILPKGEEIATKSLPAEAVVELAENKAKEVADSLTEDAIVLGADTIVVLENYILGKPHDQQEAFKMLSLLNGKSHFVYTGVAVIVKSKETKERYSFYEKTRVTMSSMSDKEILSYIKTKEPLDKAGAYGIQGKGAVYIQEIVGDYNNVVGLPVARIYQEMEKLGIEIYANSYYDD